ncbi:uncharacterized protein LOC117821650 [Xyrichtys novacula]|uniref:Uncharacterized protein LOC117821650 n=1 Tax=Xyrichtys novacula TaxID=13765 RepID=A0AAV1HIK7_XYRNO|nr:uncharacterized protein LOC117821650 [Xyrichtys novacula]
MSTASIADVSKINFSNKDDGHDWSNTGQSQAQCTPRPLPALGTFRILYGNGTNVGTVMSLQCPAKYKVVGHKLTCVQQSNSTEWMGNIDCMPLTRLEDFGFRVAVLASIVSLGIIFYMSMAFITCCLLDCIKEEKKGKEERDPELWQTEEQPQQPEDCSSHRNVGWNNNNNNTQEKLLSSEPTLCDDMQACRCHLQYMYEPSQSTCGSSSLVSALPGCDYDQPLLPPNPGYAQISWRTSQHVRPPCSSLESASPDSDQTPEEGPCLLRQYGGHQASLSGGNSSRWASHQGPKTESSMRSTKKEFSIRVISV